MRPLVRLLFAFSLGLASFAGAAANPGPGLQVTTLPDAPVVVAGRDGLSLNFDLVFDNPSARPLELMGIEVTWFDREGRFLGQRRLDRNGDPTTMGIATVANRTLPANGRLVLFNPFQHFPAGTWLGDLRYTATFEADDEAASQVELRVAPQPWVGKTPLSLPLSGPLFVHDGHDLTAHHRRLDITGGMTTHFGIKGNFMRYAHDFCITDDAGNLYRGDGAAPEDWFGYGAPVLATGEGTVVAMRDGMADNRRGGPPGFTQEQIMQDLTLFLGNYVVLDHGNGEFSLFAHMKQGSVGVRTGERVARGVQLGAMGMSGDAFLVHLHYQLQSGAGFEEGLPAVFEGVQFATGDGWSVPATVPVDSGDRVRTASR